jgi:hypothetical protein
MSGVVLQSPQLPLSELFGRLFIQCVTYEHVQAVILRFRVILLYGERSWVASPDFTSLTSAITRTES